MFIFFLWKIIVVVVLNMLFTVFSLPWAITMVNVVRETYHSNKSKSCNNLNVL